MKEKIKNVKEWFAKNKDGVKEVAEISAKGFFNGLVYTSAYLYTLMVISALVTGKKWYLEKKDN